jgi:sensor domain CHASE-containing protein
MKAQMANTQLTAEVVREIVQDEVGILRTEIRTELNGTVVQIVGTFDRHMHDSDKNFHL